MLILNNYAVSTRTKLPPAKRRLNTIFVFNKLIAIGCANRFINIKQFIDHVILHMRGLLILDTGFQLPLRARNEYWQDCL